MTTPEECDDTFEAELNRMEALLTTAAEDPTSDEGRVALGEARLFWRMFCDAFRAGLTRAAALPPDQRERMRCLAEETGFCAEVFALAEKGISP